MGRGSNQKFLEHHPLLFSTRNHDCACQFCHWLRQPSSGWERGLVSHDSGRPAGSARHHSLRARGLVTGQARRCCYFADALRVIAASRLFPIVQSGSRASCHLEPPPDLGPLGWGWGCFPPRPSFGMESILLCFLLPTHLPQLQVLHIQVLTISMRPWGQRPHEP